MPHEEFLGCAESVSYYMKNIFDMLTLYTVQCKTSNGVNTPNTNSRLTNSTVSQNLLRMMSIVTGLDYLHFDTSLVKCKYRLPNEFGDYGKSR